MDWNPYIQRVEAEMQALIAAPHQAVAPFYGMMAYHLGWLDRGFQPAEGDGGKRFRPVLCLLACQAQGGDWERTIPAAAAIELIHNFSLIHDDIQDGSPMRRHRDTVWHIWGVPQALNAGDGMHVVAHLAMQRLRQGGVPAEQVLEALRILDETSLTLCHGQYLDLAFEERTEISVDEYLYMIGAKSAALISASARIGALLGGAEPGAVEAYGRFGWEMGLAFQMVDDILGIWGDPQVTGKSAASDILSRKKTLPVLYALERGRGDGAGDGHLLTRLYEKATLEEADVAQVLALLDEAGARYYAQAQAQAHTDQALAALQETGGRGPAQEELARVARSFLERTF